MTTCQKLDAANAARHDATMWGVTGEYPETSRELRAHAERRAAEQGEGEAWADDYVSTYILECCP